MNRAILILVAVIAGFGLLFVLLRGLDDIRPSVQREECRQHLRTLYDAIDKYVSANGNLPRDQNGQVSLALFAAQEMPVEYRVNREVLKCPAINRATGIDYFCNPELSAADFFPHSHTVIACDRPENHPDFMLMLLGDGSVRFFIAPLENREKWTQLFLSGDQESRKFYDPDEPQLKANE